MSCIASAVRRRIASGSTFRNVPSGVSNVDTPSVETSRYCVSSWLPGPCSGSSSVYAKSGWAETSAMAASLRPASGGAHFTA